MLSRFKPLSDSEIDRMEKEFHISLPGDYRMFLKETGGGVVEKDNANRYIIPGINEEISVDVLFGADEEIDDSSTIFYWMHEYQDELLRGALIIGDDLMQGFLVLICDGDDKGVYYWDDAYHFVSSDDENNMYKIADSFQDFIERIG